MLRQLRLLGFIDASDSISHLIDDKRPNVNLTEEIALTPLGESYLSSPIAHPSIAPSTTNRKG